MNLLGIVALDFVKRLRSASTGWRVTPLVTERSLSLYHGGCFNVRPIPHSVSPDDFFEKFFVDTSTVIISIKQKKRPLRLLSLTFTGCDGVVTISYWRANGYVQHQISHKFGWARIYKMREDPTPAATYHEMKVYGIIRIVRGRKKKTRCVDSFDIACPDNSSMGPAIETVVKTINKSYDWLGRGKSEHFDTGIQQIAIDLDGKNYEMGWEPPC